MTLGDLLCVSVLDLVRILGSTRGWFPCLSPPSFTRHSCFASRILDARDSYLQFSGSVPLRSLAQGTQPFVGPLASPEMVSSRPELGVLTNLRFPDPGHFKAGMIHESFPVWQRLLADYSCAVDLLEILRDGVRVENFFTPFRGDFKGQFYHAQTPPSIQIKNAAICGQFADFISDAIVRWVASWVLSVWREVGVVSPPHLVLPITIEPSKPPLCYDERFLNLWIRDLQFKLDHLADLPRYVLPGISRQPLMTRVATSMFGSIRRGRRTLGSSGIISFLCFVRSPLGGRPAPIFIII